MPHDIEKRKPILKTVRPDPSVRFPDPAEIAWLAEQVQEAGAPEVDDPVRPGRRRLRCDVHWRRGAHRGIFAGRIRRAPAQVRSARIAGMIDPEVKLSFAYYTSDIPPEPDSSLAVKLSAQDGVPAVYAVTRAILRRILGGAP